MKKEITFLSLVALLAGCGTSRDADKTWSQDCEANYSLTGREKNKCLERVKEQQTWEVTPGQITIDPDNADNPEYETVGKGGRGHNNL